MKRNKLKCFICVLLAVFMLILPACKEADATDTSSTSSDDVSALTSDFALSEFQIVRSDKAKSDIVDAVVEFNGSLKEQTGVSMTIVTDLSAKKETACEIVVGNTTREASKSVLSELGVGEYAIRSVKTDNGMKVIVCGENDNATVYALQNFLTFCVSAYKQGAHMGMYDLKENYYSKFESFHVEFGEPVVIAQGKTHMEMGWGPMQFPSIEMTTNGDIMALWSTTTDSLLDLVAANGSAVSEDGGKTWRDRNGTDKIISDVKMSNGKYFFGFETSNAYVVDYLNKYEPVYSYESSWDGKVNVYNASKMEEVSNVVQCYEYNPTTGQYDTFQSTIIWPNMPLASYEKIGGAILPLTQVMSGGGRINCITIGKDIYMCLPAPDLDPVTGQSTANGASCVYIFKSSDSARTWTLHSRVCVPDDVYEEWHDDSNFDGFTECKMEVVPDGSVTLLIRMGRNIPSYITHSTDNCATWSEPELFDKCGVWPQLLTLDCGVTIATYGRVGLYLRATSDPSAKVWEDPISIKLTSSREENTCAYTGLLPLSDTEFLMIYTDFYYPNADGTPVKTILAMTVTIVPDSP